MQVFVSYTRDTRANLEPVLNGLRRLGHTVWFDEELTGGDQWWATVLQRIREADVFIAALSPSYFESTPCFEESQYATALGKPILPVSIQSLRGTIVPQDLTQLQIVDYSTPGDKAAFELMAAVANVRPAAGLPDPLPALPPTPLSYGPEREMIQRPTLSYDEQLKLVETLAWHVNHQPREDQRQAAVALLKQLRARPDITMRASELLSQALSKEKAGDGVGVAGNGAQPGGTRTDSGTEPTGAPPTGAGTATADAVGAGVAAGPGGGPGSAGPSAGAGVGAGGGAGSHGQINWTGGPVPPRFPQPPPPAITPAPRPSHTGRNVAIGVLSGIAVTIALIVVVVLLVAHGPAPSPSNQADNSPTPLPATPTPTPAPANFVFVSAPNWAGSCSATDGCPMSATLKDEGGPGNGSVTFHILLDSNNADLADCTATIAYTDAGGSATASCTAVSGDLATVIDYYAGGAVPIRIYAVVSS